MELSFAGKPQHEAGGLNFRLTGFYTILKNAIIRRDFYLPDGNTLYIDGTDTLKVVANQNASKSLTGGFSLGAEYKYGDLTFSANAVYTKGYVYNEGEAGRSPAPHIPPLFGNFKASYQKEKLKMAFVLQFNGKKPASEYGGSVDNPDLAPPGGAYAWHTFNLYLTYRFSSRFSLKGAVENILDIHYRPFASGVSAPGRNFIIAVSGTF